MKEWKLRLLIIFSMLSITGLIIIQAYWIRDAVRIKENHFRQTVNQAVTNAVWRLEHMAISHEEDLRNNIIENKRERLMHLDSLNRADTISFESLGAQSPEYPLQTEPPLNKQIPGFSDTSPSSSDIHDSSAINSGSHKPWMKKDDQYFARLDIVTDSVRWLTNMGNNLSEDYQNTRRYLEQVMDKLSEIQHSPPANEWLDSALINEIVKEELEKENIRLSFVYGVYFPFTGNLIYCDTSHYKNQLLSSGFVYSLFPNFKLAKPVYLILKFPGEKEYLFTRLSWMLALSIILIIVLIWSFYFITRNIYRQKKLGEMKNDFINNMTHEFKTPVSTISLACEALRDQDVDKSATLIEDYLKIIEEENRRLGKLSEQILQTAVIDKGHLYLYFESLSFHDLVLQIVENYKPAIKQRSGILATKLLASNPVIVGDKSHLYNVISNLVDNGIKYSREKPEIEILTRDDNNTFTVSIQDKGVGISKSNQKKIFDKLYRVPTGNIHNVKGFGLGLSYVKYIVERHQGTVTVESEINKGSQFIITLPRLPINSK